MPRSFLFLQGTASPFFRELSQALRTRGHSVRRVNYCGGDVLYGGREGAMDYRGKREALPRWYEEKVSEFGVTDVLMFGDCREIHRSMHPVAQALGAQVHVFEEGYLRPHCLTLERDGVNGRSKLPRDPAWYRDRRSHIARRPMHSPTGYNLYERAFHDIRYRAANAVYAHRFPYFKSHRPRNGFIEYAGLAARALRQQGYKREATRVMQELLTSGRPYYLFPLQLNSDAQIVVHSPFDGIREALDTVIRSFACHAPAQSCLVVKNHPLDTGLIEYRRYAQRVASECGVEKRLYFIDAGDLDTLLEHARGVVLVNSTSGLAALERGRPLIALGNAIYDMAGLTWQGTLDDFWRDGVAPDRDLFQCFVDYVLDQTQINGDFYTRSGIAMAVAGSVARLEGTSQ